MAEIKVAVIVGSMRKASVNRKLAHALEKLAPADVKFDYVQIDDLPHYNQDDDANNAEQVKRIKAQITAADAVLFVTPEYNRSIPGIMKNAIDHASRPYGKSVWAGKPGGVIGISMGPMKTSMAQQHLRNILAYLDVPTMNQPEAFLQATEGYFDAEGNVTNPDNIKFLQLWMDKYVAWIKKTK